jgi:cell wall assembly regulator SMI1
VKVDIQPDVHDIAARLGADAPYALKALAGRLADDPDLGRPSGLPGILTVTVDGDMFDDCPDLNVGYIREPDRIEIRFLTAVSSAETFGDGEDAEEGSHDERTRPAEPAHLADPVADAVTVRQVADAWQRFTGRLRRDAPDSYAALRPGASVTALAALEADLGVPIPIELRVLWQLTAGDDGAGGWGCLPGNRALLPLDAVAAVHRRWTDAQAQEDARGADRAEDERITVWKATWIPVVAWSPADFTSGLYLDAATGCLGRWSRYGESPDEELDTLVTYLEEAADMLESPALATRDTPGLIGGTLVWRSGLGRAGEGGREDRWRPLSG